MFLDNPETRARNEKGEEDINAARFELYLESNTKGPSATIKGNTIPGDKDLFGTLAEGLYSAEFKLFKERPAILIGEGGGLPTIDGNPNNPANYNEDGTLKPIEDHIMNGIYFHRGNYGRKSLTYDNDGELGYISEGCQTGPNSNGSYGRYLIFMKSAAGFKGNYYLRSNLIEGGNLGTANVVGTGNSRLKPILNVKLIQ